jgi:hypothetical protein
MLLSLFVGWHLKGNTKHGQGSIFSAFDSHIYE